MKILKSILFAALFLINFNASAQTYFTKSGRITFLSKTSMENIEAANNEVTSFIDVKKGELVFAVLIKSFKFKKALMEEHFNENYMESNTFPKANFKGMIADVSKVNFLKEGTYDAIIKGDLTIHGVTKNIQVPATIIILKDKINATSKFNINVKDYNIKIPATVVNNVSETLTITVDCKYDLFKRG